MLPLIFCSIMNYEPLLFEPEAAKDVPAFLNVCSDPWLAPPSPLDVPEALSSGGESLRRVQSATAKMFDESDMQSWAVSGTGTGPLPIRPTRRANVDDFSSLESSQSVLAMGHANSVPEDSSVMQYYPRAVPRYGFDVPLGPQDALAAVELAINAPPAAASVYIPAQGGHWAWVPSSSNDPAPPPAGPPAIMVPINSGPLPLPVQMAPNPTSNHAASVDFDMDFLDSFDIMEMADNLTCRSAPARPKRVAASCPLPTLLEDSLSAEDDGSDDTMHAGILASPSLETLDRTGSGTLTSGSRRVGVAVPGARSTPLKLHRPPRSASHPHLPTVMATSLPVNTERPMRTAARRSLVVTAAALRDAVEDSDSDASEGLPGSYGGPTRRAGAHHHAARHSHHHGAALAKKKHNPWTLEETLALVEGVRLAGVGKWAEIKRLPVPGVSDILDTRTPVDLKDKWRNLTRVARLPKAALRQRLQRGPSDVPLETMLAVKLLMEVGQDAE